jgi:hypothetical protein
MFGTSFREMRLTMPQVASRLEDRAKERSESIAPSEVPRLRLDFREMQTGDPLGTVVVEGGQVFINVPDDERRTRIEQAVTSWLANTGSEDVHESFPVEPRRSLPDFLRLLEGELGAEYTVTLSADE